MGAERMAETGSGAAAREGEAENAVAEYKGILRSVLDNRPSGTRQRLAEAIGKNRSFVSQISNPAYPTPIPAEHVERILELCHFSSRERSRFLDAYRRAHPRRFQTITRGARSRTLTLAVPDLGDEEANRSFDQMIADLVRRAAKLIGRGGGEGGGRQ